MEEFVQLSLNTYDSMCETINRYPRENTKLKQELKDEQEDKQRIINKAEVITKKLRECILATNLNDYYFGTTSLDELTGFENWRFAMNNKETLIKYGITKEEMIDFITRKKEEYDKEN